MGPELLTVEEMGRADRLTIEGAAGRPAIPGSALMEAAGAAIVDAILTRWTRRPTLVLCGPGNNGGDGWVVARLLTIHGWPVRVASLVDPAGLSGDASEAARRWEGPVERIGEGGDAPVDLPGDAALVVDALFGAGLARPVEGAAAAVLEAVAARGVPVVAVDVPSGVDGNTGAVRGTAMPAGVTVTFFRKKPGHVLLPGRELAGIVRVAEIGIPDSVLDILRPAAAENVPALWQAALPRPRPGDHKYTRGHVLIPGGARMTGASRLAAQAARRIGAGLVSILAPDSALAIYAAGPPGLLVTPIETWDEELADPRRNAVLVGPGLGVGEEARSRALSAAKAGKALVLDADGLTAFADAPDALFAALGPSSVLTPHEGEFARLFGSSVRDGADKLARARSAAARSGAVLLLKGADTVIAAPDGRAVINANAPPWLATAGSGDVLAGLVVGLLAQGMPAFESAAAAAWIHGAAASAFGPGLIAEDLIDGVPSVLAGVYEPEAENTERGC
ncbi:MAG: NAD(P)H-hydrate dehydratase [Azospirillaceae bacterium]